VKLKITKHLIISTSTDIIIIWLLLLLLLQKKLSSSFAGSSICSGLRSTGQQIPTSNDTGSDSDHDDYCNTNENYRIFIHMHNNNRDTVIHIASIYENQWPTQSKILERKYMNDIENFKEYPFLWT